MRTYRWTLDLQMFSQEKTESATPKKRQDSTKKGQVAKSQRASRAHLFYCSCFFSFMMLGGYYKERMIRMFGLIFEQKLTMEMTTGNILTLFSDMMMQGFMLLAANFLL